MQDTVKLEEKEVCRFRDTLEFMQKLNHLLANMLFQIFMTFFCGTEKKIFGKNIMVVLYVPKCYKKAP